VLIAVASKDAAGLAKMMKAKRVWENFYLLACLSAQACVVISEEEWRAHGMSLLAQHGNTTLTLFSPCKRLSAW
jgi:hypothetical protein